MAKEPAECPTARELMDLLARAGGRTSRAIDGRGDGKAAGGFGVSFGNLKVVTPR